MPISRGGVVGHQNVFTDAMRNAGSLVNDSLNMMSRRRAIMLEERKFMAESMGKVLEMSIKSHAGGPQQWAQIGENAQALDEYLRVLGVNPLTRKDVVDGLRKGLMRPGDILEMMGTSMIQEGWTLQTGQKTAETAVKQARERVVETGPPEQPKEKEEIVEQPKTTSEREDVDVVATPGRIIPRIEKTDRGFSYSSKEGIMASEGWTGLMRQYLQPGRRLPPASLVRRADELAHIAYELNKKPGESFDEFDIRVRTGKVDLLLPGFNPDSLSWIAVKQARGARTRVLTRDIQELKRLEEEILEKRTPSQGGTYFYQRGGAPRPRVVSPDEWEAEKRRVEESLR